MGPNMSLFSWLFKKKARVEELKNHGLDLSHHNNLVDLSKLIKEKFVILKATEGIDNTDQKFASRFLGLQVLGVRRGAYHFYRTNKDPIEQAKHFLSVIGPLKGDEILALDYETCEIHGLIQTMDDLKTHKRDALAFMDYIWRNTKILPWFYTYHAAIQEIEYESSFAFYPLWYARYTSIIPDQVQGPWKSWIAWQYKSDGSMDGVSGDVDMNWLNDLRTL